MASKKIIEWKGADGVMYTCCEKVVQKKQDDGSWFQFKPGQLIRGEDGVWYEIACTLNQTAYVSAGLPVNKPDMFGFRVAWLIVVTDEAGTQLKEHAELSVPYIVTKSREMGTIKETLSNTSAIVPANTGQVEVDETYTQDEFEWELKFEIFDYSGYELGTVTVRTMTMPATSGGTSTA